MQIRIQRIHPDAILPAYAHGPLEDSGMDLHAVEDVTLEPGLPLKHAITLPNAPGTIDPGYRGEIRVILLNLGREPYTVHSGDRIAQMVVARYEAVEWLEERLADSTRGDGGFGSSGR